MKAFDRLRWIAASIAIAMALAGCASSSSAPTSTSKRGMPQDIGGIPKEEQFREIDAPLPPYPQEGELLQFPLRRNSDNRYFVDRTSVSIGADRVIRYSTVVKSPSGATSTSYEAMRCKTAEYRIYAFGVAGGWTASRNSGWQQIPRASGDFRFTLYKDYFCDSEAIAGHSAKALIANLTGNSLKSPPDRNR